MFCSSSYLRPHAEMTESARVNDTRTDRILRVPASMKAKTSYKVQRQNIEYLKEVYGQNIASVHACSAFMLYNHSLAMVFKGFCGQGKTRKTRGNDMLHRITGENQTRFTYGLFLPTVLA